MTCSDLSISKIAWNHRRGACFFLVSLKSLRINHHYSISFLEERLYSPLYLRVYFSMSRRHKTRFFLIMLEWETAPRPPVKRKNCYWAASTWCSAFNPWEVIASDSSFFSLDPARSDPPAYPCWFLLLFRSLLLSGTWAGSSSSASRTDDTSWVNVWFLRDVFSNICHPTYNTSTYITLTRITRTFSLAVS